MELAAEGYTDIIVTRHQEGPLLKLYVVGDEIVNASDACAAYEALVRDVRRTMHLDIFGVDLILTEQGPVIIDVNDFPSFSACREVAAEKIAACVKNNGRY